MAVTEVKVATLLNYPILDVCPCGKKVALCDRQELVFSQAEQSWKRACGACIAKDRNFKSVSDVFS